MAYVPLLVCFGLLALPTLGWVLIFKAIDNYKDQGGQ